MRRMTLCRWGLMLLFLILAATNYGAAPKECLAMKIAQKVKRNMDLGGEYGSYIKVVTTNRNGDAPSEKDERIYRTVWISNQTYHELVQIDGNGLSHKDQVAEARRRLDFVKAAQKKSQVSGIQQELGAISWWEVPEKYQLTALPTENGAQYVFSFRPKDSPLQDRCRVERILNHLEGKVWLDKEWNVLKAEAHLTGPVRFGLGMLATIDHAEINYTQHRYEQVWLPASVSVSWSGRFALLSRKRQELQVSWFDPYLKTDLSYAALSAERIPATATGEGK